MEIQEVSCPKCGAPLREVADEGFFDCPYCGARIRVTLKGRSRDVRPDGRKIIREGSTGEELAYAKLPRDWAAEGTLARENQSPASPFTLYINCKAPDNSAAMFCRSAYVYRENFSGYAHVEGGYDALDKTPLKRMITAEQAADETLIQLAGKCSQLRLVGTTDYPSLPPLDRERKKRELTEQYSAEIRRASPAGMTGGVKDATFNGCTRIYTYRQPNGEEITHAVAAIVDSVTIFGGAPMMNLLGMGISYRAWEIQSIVSLKALTPRFSEYKDALVAFCSTVQAAPKFYEMAREESASYYGNLQQQQADSFAAQQRAMRTRQEAFDSYNRAWMERSNRSFEARRASYNSRQSSADRISEMRSEAIRGVNTYIRPDGSEVEYSVAYDHAYAAPDGSTVASNSTEAPKGWTEMDRKY